MVHGNWLGCQKISDRADWGLAYRENPRRLRDLPTLERERIEDCTAEKGCEACIPLSTRLEAEVCFSTDHASKRFPSFLSWIA